MAKFQKLLLATAGMALWLFIPVAQAGEDVLHSTAAPDKGGHINLLPIYPVPDYASQSRSIGLQSVNDPSLDTTPADLQFNAAIAVLNGGKISAAYGDLASQPVSLNYMGFSYSSTGGANWTDGGPFWGAAPTQVVYLPWAASHLASNSVYVASQSLGAGALWLYKSTNGGKTWLNPVNAAPGVGSVDIGRIAVDNAPGAGNGFIYACYRDTSDGLIHFTRSTNGGATFGPNPGLIISATGGGLCSVAVGPNHEVYAAYFRGDAVGGLSGNNKLFIRKSTNRGVSFGPEVQVADLLSTSSYGSLSVVGATVLSIPQVAVNPDPAKPFVYVVYNDDTVAAPTDQSNIFMVRSTNGGSTWSAPQAVDAGPRDQYSPAMAFASAGNMFIGYYSRAHDPLNVLSHWRGRIGKVSATGTVAFNPPFQLSPNAPSFPITYWNEAAGLAGKAYTVWTDMRNGDAFVAHQTDVQFAAITLPPPSADLSLQVTASPSTIAPLALSVVRVRVNSAGGPSNDAYLNIRANAGLVMRSASGGDCKLDGAFLGCSLGTIPAGGHKDVYVTVAGSLPTGVQKLFMNATTSSKDTAPANNAATKAITISNTGTALVQPSTGNVSVAIPDNTPAGVDIPIVVSNGGPVVKVTADVRIQHTWDSDLNINLIDPMGHTIDLSSGNGGSADNFGSGATDCTGTFTTFDDAAATSITTGLAPFAGTYKPEGSLSTFYGFASAGTWKLHIVDTVAGDTGTVKCVRLNITRLP